MSTKKYEYDPRTGTYYRVDPPVAPVGRIDFQRVRLNRDGYTSSGKYFGTGAPLYEWYDEESGKTFTTRAGSRAEAKAHFEKVRRGLVEYGGYNPMRRRKSSRRHAAAGGLTTGQKVAIGAAGVAVLFVVGSLVMVSTASASEGPSGATGATGATGGTGSAVGLTGAAGVGFMVAPVTPSATYHQRRHPGPVYGSYQPELGGGPYTAPPPPPPTYPGPQGHGTQPPDPDQI